MIKRIAFSRLTHNELLTLSSRIIAAIEAVASVNTGILATILGLLKTAYNKFLPLVNRNRKSSYRELLKEKDTNRDDAFRALRDVTLGYSRRLNDTFRISARRLLEIFTRNGWTIYLDGYQEESAELNQLISELEGKEAADAINTLQLADMFNELKTAQKEFEETFQNKASDVSKEEYAVMSEIRQEVIENLSGLLERIDSDAKYAPNADEYTTLIATLNNIITETGTVLKARITRGNNHDTLPESEQPAELEEQENE